MANLTESIDRTLEIERAKYTNLLDQVIRQATEAKHYFASHVGQNIGSRCSELVAVVTRIEILEGIKFELKTRHEMSEVK